MMVGTVGIKVNNTEKTIFFCEFSESAKKIKHFSKFSDSPDQGLKMKFLSVLIIYLSRVKGSI